MKTLKGTALFLLLFLLPACGQQLVELGKPGTKDAGTADVRIADARIADVGSPDVRNPDVENIDVASPDARNSDLGTIDAASPDAGNPDVGTTDAGIRDGTNLDARTTDAGTSDARTTDAGTSDARTIDAGNSDGRATDAGNSDARTTDAGNSDARSTDAANIDAANIDAPNIDAGDADATNTDAGDSGIANGDAGPVIVIDLGLATPFAIAATAGVTNTITEPITHINGDVVLDPNKTCNAVTVDTAGGFGLCGGMPPIISGTVITNLYPDTTTSTAIRAALNAAFLSITPLAGPPAVGTLGGGTTIAAPTTLGDAAGSSLVLEDNWFTPGVYTSGTSILITGDVTLDGQGDPNATFVFQSASTLTTADGALSPGAHTRILLTNGAKASNVWWQVASSATIGSYSEFQGNILAAFNITMKTGASACGRSMAGAWVGGGGAFVFDSNVVSVPGNGCPL
jgi:Protein of unknown function (DUF3494).